MKPLPTPGGIDGTPNRSEAHVAVAVLTQDGHEERLNELAGPRLLTFADSVGAIAEAANRPIKFLEITPEQYTEDPRSVGPG